MCELRLVLLVAIRGHILICESPFLKIKLFTLQIFKKMDLTNHGLILLQQLNAQREFGFLCDCTVAIGDVYFKAHKSVLASFSNYFKMLFVHQTR